MIRGDSQRADLQVVAIAECSIRVERGMGGQLWLPSD
jgi:hypothetical protein